MKEVFTLAIPVEDYQWYQTHSMLMNMSFASTSDISVASSTEMSDPVPYENLFNAPVPAPVPDVPAVPLTVPTNAPAIAPTIVPTIVPTTGMVGSRSG